MLIEDLAVRLEKVEKELAGLKELVQPAGKKAWRETFGMFADDEGFDEALRLGREYREEANREENE